MGQKDKDKEAEKIRQLIAIMKENDLVELEIKHGEDKILLKRAQAFASAAQLAGPVAGGVVPAGVTVPPPGVELPRQDKPAENLVEITSPLVGTFYAAPSPDSEPFVDIGTHVEPQTVVGIIEAMKVMNEIKAETRGTIKEILVKNGEAVEYGQVLFRLSPEGHG